MTAAGALQQGNTLASHQPPPHDEDGDNGGTDYDDRGDEDNHEGDGDSNGHSECFSEKKRE